MTNWNFCTCQYEGQGEKIDEAQPEQLFCISVCFTSQAILTVFYCFVDVEKTNNIKQNLKVNELLFKNTFPFNIVN